MKIVAFTENQVDNALTSNQQEVMPQRYYIVDKQAIDNTAHKNLVIEANNKDITSLLWLFTQNSEQHNIDPALTTFALDLYQNASNLQDPDETSSATSTKLVNPIDQAKFSKRQRYNGKI